MLKLQKEIYLTISHVFDLLSKKYMDKAMKIYYHEELNTNKNYN